MPLDEGCARQMFDLAFDAKGGILGVIGAEGGRLEGGIGLLLTRWWYTKVTHIEEYFNFVDPDFRRTDHAVTLIAFAKRCADEIRIPLAIGVLSMKRTSAKVRLYRKSLGYPKGAFFVYNSPWGDDGDVDKEFWRSPFPRHSEKKNGRARRIESNG